MGVDRIKGFWMETVGQVMRVVAMVDSQIEIVMLADPAFCPMREEVVDGMTERSKSF